MRRRTRKNGDEPGTSFYRRVLLQLREERRTHLKRFPRLDTAGTLAQQRGNARQPGLIGRGSRRILAFSALLSSDTLLHECSRFIGPVSFNRMLRVLANLLECPQNRVRDNLARSGTLLRAGLIDTFGRWSHREDLGSVLQWDSCASIQGLGFSISYNAVDTVPRSPWPMSFPPYPMRLIAVFSVFRLAPCWGRHGLAEADRTVTCKLESP